MPRYLSAATLSGRLLSAVRRRDTGRMTGPGPNPASVDRSLTGPERTPKGITCERVLGLPVWALWLPASVVGWQIARRELAPTRVLATALKSQGRPVLVAVGRPGRIYGGAKVDGHQGRSRRRPTASRGGRFKGASRRRPRASSIRPRPRGEAGRRRLESPVS
jgi:hypothetical protein